MGELSKDELRIKLEKLTRQHSEKKADKKTAMKCYNDDLKEIQEEIDGVLDDLKIAE